MSADRFVLFASGFAHPSVTDLDSLLADYVGSAARVEFHVDRFIVTFPGECSAALRRVGGRDFYTERQERWLEVVLDRETGTVDVLTRRQDEYVGAVADGLAALIARHWDGRIGPP